MELNDNKAGMEGLEKAKINAIIKEASKNSRYFKHQLKRDERIKEKIEQQKTVLKTFTPEKLQLALLQMDRLVEELESQRDLSRTIIHVDMDAFYAAVEMRDDPSLREKPMAVGSTSMLSTSNYAARKFGVRAAQPGFIGKKLCPDLIIVPCNFEKYTKSSEEIRKVMKEYDPNFVPMSLDEAYLDITDYLFERKKNLNNKTIEHCRKRYSGQCNCRLPYDSSLVNLSDSSEFEEISEEICPKCDKKRMVFVDKVEFCNTVEDVVNELRFKIEQATGLTASAGIAANAMLAKVCSDKNKPNGQYYLPPDKTTIMNFVKVLPIRKVCGIGGVSEAMLKGLEINNCGDLFEKRAVISLLYSKISTKFFLKVSLGLGSSMFEHRDNDRKSVSVERTFSEISNPDQLLSMCEKLCDKLADDIKEEEVKGRTVGIKIKTVDFEIHTKAQTLDRYVSESQALYQIAKQLLLDEIKAVAPGNLRLRLLGVRLSNLVSKNEPEFHRKTDNSKEITDFFKPVVTKEDSCEAAGAIFATNDDSMDCVILSDPEEENSEKLLDKNCENLDDKDSSIISEDSIQILSQNEESNFTAIMKEECSESSKLSSSTICPVCNIKQRNVTDLVLFNAHVDQCLSRKTIGELNKEKSSFDNNNSVHLKRKNVSSSAVVPPKRTLVHYFVKKT